MISAVGPSPGSSVAGMRDVPTERPARTTVDADAAQAALAETVGRLGRLLRAVPAADRPALGRWTIGDVAAHLLVAFEGLSQLAGCGIPSPIDSVDVFAETMDEMARAVPERNLAVLAQRIEATAAEFLAGPAVTDPDGPRPWIFAGTQAAGTTFVCHLLDEVLVHGDDIARAAGLAWPIDRAHAVLALEGFLFVVLRQLPGHALLDQRRAAGLRARYRLSIRGGSQLDLAIADGSLSVAEPSDRPVDCHLSADPVALLLLFWGRRGQWPAIARGRLTAWGRRPWLAPRLGTVLVAP